MLTQAELQPYRDMRAAGASPAEVYVAAFWNHQKHMRRRDILMKVFGLSEPEAMAIAKKADALAFEKYATQRDAGRSLEDVVRAAFADGHSLLDTVVILIRVFGITNTDAHQIVKSVGR